MALEIFYRGQSAPVNLTLRDENLVPINLATFSDIWVVIYHKKSKVEMESYQDTIGDIITVDAAAGEIRVILNNDDTEEAPTGVYSVDVRTSEVDVAYALNTRYRASSADIIELKDLEE